MSKKIIFFIPEITGGAGRVVSVLANGLAARHYRVAIAVFANADMSKCIYTISPDVEIVHLDHTVMACGIKGLWALRKAIQALQPDVLIGFLFGINVQIAMAMLHGKIPVIISERTDFKHDMSSFNWKGRLLARYAFQHVEAFVCQTNAIKKFAVKSWWKLPKKKLRVIYNPVRPFVIHENPHLFAGPKFVAMGRLHPQKGFDLLLQAFGTVKQSLPAWNLVIWGEGNERERLELLRSRLGLDGSVFLPGETTDSYAQLSVADIFVLSSRYEGYPNVLLEAMAAGCPVIANDCNYGPAEIITAGQDGILIADNRPETLANAMISLAKNPSLCSNLSEKAKDIARKISEDEILNQWENLLLEVFKRRPACYEQ